MAELSLKVENLVTYAVAATELGVSRPTVYSLVDKYKLHPVIIGNNRYIMKDELEALKKTYSEEKLKEQGK